MVMMAQGPCVKLVILDCMFSTLDGARGGSTHDQRIECLAVALRSAENDCQLIITFQ